jgi:sec-independent protein translocase protein TatA
MPGLGPWELVIILLIVVVIFGAGRLSEIGGALGKSVREFRSATGEDKEKEKQAREQAALNASTSTPVAPGSSTAPAGTATAPVSTTTENKCPSCATVNPPGQVFCGQCGTRLTRAA